MIAKRNWGRHPFGARCQAVRDYLFLAARWGAHAGCGLVDRRAVSIVYLVVDSAAGLGLASHERSHHLGPGHSRPGAVAGLGALGDRSFGWN